MVLPETATKVCGMLLGQLQSVRDVAIPNGVKKIDSCWFYGSHVVSVSVPESVAEIGDSAFRYCLDLR